MRNKELRIFRIRLFACHSLELTLTFLILCNYATTQEVITSPHFTGPIYGADDDSLESETQADGIFRPPEEGAVEHSRYGLADDIAEAASEIQEAMKQLQQSEIWPELSVSEYRNNYDRAYGDGSEAAYTPERSGDGDYMRGSETYLHRNHYLPNGSYYRTYKNPPLKRSYGEKDFVNGNSTFTYTPRQRNETNDTEVSGSEVQEEEASEQSEGIPHEEGNIPFEWRVQLIHRNMGNSWKNRADKADAESRADNDRWYDRFTDHMGYGRLRERYTKKKVDILIEEWWNKEKWNRKYWNDYVHQDEADNKHHSKDYHNSDKHHSRYGQNRGDHKRKRKHGRGSHSRGKKGRHYYQPHYDSSNSAYEEAAPSHYVLQNITNHTGDQNLQKHGYMTYQANRYNDPGDVVGRKPRLRVRPLNTWNAYQPKMEASSFLRPRQDGRPACARPHDDFCETDYSYPNDVIQRLIAANESAWRSLSASAQARWKPFIFRPNKEAISQSQSGSTTSCHGDVREVRPLWAPNYNGRWKIIVNTGKYRQTFMMDKCSKRTWVCAKSQDYTCKQKRGYLPLVALDLTNTTHELHTDWFVLPSSCACRPTNY